ncbi:T6SS phospholipase effector Tle1-like catalytic domain-containing protein [Pararhodobacter sp.]|uniref:T6SS phospholipase effector Tle1-like catalytic domain-containing protein n=1 Tax=Pararhodobacter sp. TaxID=2127056 RepID=UPI002FE07DCF
MTEAEPACPGKRETGPKTIVLLFDGTANSLAENPSHILRLYGCLQKSDRQLVWYAPGVGTLGGQGLWSRAAQRFLEVWGMITGFGVDQNVKAAYRFLAETYDDGKREEGEDRPRDRIVIMGFSRGAYSARMLAGFLHTIGLIPPRTLNLLDHAWRAYKRIGERADEGADAAQRFAEVGLYEKYLNPDRPPIHLLGLFDTVSSVIEPGPWGRPVIRRHHASTLRNPSVAHVRHAVAVHERRRLYRAVLWPQGQDFRRHRFREESAVPQDLREVWFAGSHRDVGGGLPPAESALGRIPLRWMIEETAALGLVYSPASLRTHLEALPPGPGMPDDARAPVHPSMTFWWRLVEFIPPPTFGRGRTIPEGAELHPSVRERPAQPV